MSATSQPNVLLLILDACRIDHVREYAPTLCRLGNDGIWCENAIAPATWTQPSHASIFTGEYPHVHGITQPSQSTAPTDLIDAFGEHGYSTHGVSGNGFVSPLWSTDRAFDTFRYTQTPEPFAKGFETYTYLRNHIGNQPKSAVARNVVRECLTHDRPIQSLANLGSVGTNAFVRRYLPQLSRLPSQVFAPNPQHSYSPKKNTALLEEVIQERKRPFFAFANYMDTHRPYNASADLQKKYLGRQLSRREYIRLNDEVAAPWEFIRLEQNDEVDEEDIETLKNLYAASVESVDRHIRRLINALEEAGIRDETVIAVMGDHGENLGETDCLGRRRFGHEASISDALARVPLVIDHPTLENTLEETVSVKDVFHFLSRVADPEFPLDSLDPETLVSEPVFCEYPALGDENFQEEYPEIEKQYVRQRVSLDSVAAYQDEWRVIVESDSTETALYRGDRREIEEAPDKLVSDVRDTVGKLAQLSSKETASEVESRLKELGYL